MGRPESEILGTFVRRWPNRKRVLRLQVGDCRGLNIDVVEKPVEGNPYHAHIIPFDGERNLKSGEARSLAKKAVILVVDG